MSHDPAVPSSDGVMRSVTTVRRLYPTRLIWVSAVFGVVVALLVAGSTGASIMAGREHALAAAEDSTRSLVRAVADTVSRTVQSIDVVLASAATELADLGTIEAVPPKFAAALRGHLSFTPHLRQIVVVAPDGTIVVDSSGRANGRRIDIDDLMAEHRRLPGPLAIGAVRFNRLLGGPATDGGVSLIPMSRAIVGRDGEIRGLMVAAVNPEYFLSIFNSMDLPGGSRARLWRFDGTLLAGEGGAAQFAPGFFASAPLFRLLENSEFGTATLTAHDGMELVVSYRATHAWPLLVSVGIPVDVALAQWRGWAMAIGLPVGGISLVVLGLTAFLVGTLLRRARDEAALRLSDRVLASINNGVAIADASDPELPLVYVNSAFERITGYPADKVLGRNARFLHQGMSDQSELEHVRAALRNGGSATAVLRNVRADGSLIWNELSVFAVRDPNGRVSHFVGVQRDITERQEASERLKEAYGTVQRYSGDLERFSFILAHHLKEPARLMSVYTQIIGKRLASHPDQELRTQVGFVSEAGERLLALLRDVQLYLAVERLPITGRVADAEAAFERALQAVGKSGRALTVHRPRLPQVGIDEKRLADLFSILLDNAAEYRHPHREPELTVSCCDHGGFWKFDFADNGIGIAKQFHARVFGVFERLHTRDRHTGTGIGLAIARKIVEGADGAIGVTSDGESGSCFTFTLPKPTEPPSRGSFPASL